MVNFNVGTPFYMAPETLRNNVYNAATDIWSLGILFYEMLHGAVPFKGQNEHEI